jgi:cytochrome c oxidase subunit 2
VNRSRVPLAFAILVFTLAAYWLYYTLATPYTPQSTVFPEADLARSTHGVYTFVNVLLLSIFVVVEGVLIWVLFRFRQEDVTVGDPLPEQTHGNNAVEIGLTLATTVLVIILFIPSCQQIQFAQGPPPEGALEIDVDGKQWWWEFFYHEYDLVVANELHVPSGRPVKLNLRSTDVIHSFWVPRLGGKRDMVPGRVQTLWFTPEEPDVYDGQCAEFCGSSHALMSMQIVVDTPGDFEEWLGQQKAPAPPELAAGLAPFAVAGCMTCHMPLVNSGAIRGGLGPNLRTVATRRLIAGGLLENTPENLRSWIRNPQHIKPSAKMDIPAPQCTGEGEPEPCCRAAGIGNCLSDESIGQLVSYLETLK